MKNRLIILSMAIVIALVFAGCKPGGSARRAVEVGLAAPEFTLVNMTTGKPVSSSELRGKVVFVHFWSTD